MKMIVDYKCIIIMIDFVIIITYLYYFLQN